MSSPIPFTSCQHTLVDMVLARVRLQWGSQYHSDALPKSNPSYDLMTTVFGEDSSGQLKTESAEHIPFVVRTYFFFHLEFANRVI